MLSAERSLLLVVRACSVLAVDEGASPSSFHDIPIEQQEASSLSPVLRAIETAFDLLARGGQPGTEEGRPRRRAALRVLVSEKWLPLTNVPWSRTLASRMAAERTARMYLDAAGFELSDDDTVRVDDGDYGHACLAVTYPAALLACLQAGAEGLGAALESILPLGITVWEWNQVPQPPQAQATALLEGRTILFVRSSGNRPLLVSGGTFIAEPGMSQPDTALGLSWQRLCLRDPSLGTAPMPRVLDLAAPVSELFAPKGSNTFLGWFRKWPVRSKSLPWRLVWEAAAPDKPLNALRPRETRLRPHHAGAVLAVALAVAAAYHAYGILEELSAYQHRFAQSHSTPAQPIGRDVQARIGAVNDAVRQLNLPISPLLRGTRPPEGMRVALLGFEIVPGLVGNAEKGGALVKINAEARSADEMTRYVDFVARQPLFRSTYLKQHEMVDAKAGAPYRFVVEAVWRE